MYLINNMLKHGASHYFRSVFIHVYFTQKKTEVDMDMIKTKKVNKSLDLPLALSLDSVFVKKFQVSTRNKEKYCILYLLKDIK